MMKLSFLVCVLMMGCEGGGMLAGIPSCDTGQVYACSGTRLGTQCALCSDANLSLGCQLDHGKLATCVNDCHTCNEDAPAPSTEGVKVCGPSYVREGALCALCDNNDASLASMMNLPGNQFSTSIVCVRSCDACALSETQP